MLSKRVAFRAWKVGIDILVEVYPVTQTENPVHFENLSMRKHDDLTSVIPTLSHLKLNQTPLGEHTQAMHVSVWVTLM